MKNVFPLTPIGVASYVVAILTALLVWGVLSGKKLPLIPDVRTAFYILWVLGLAMSILAGTRDYPDGSFKMPAFLLTPLMALGILAVLLLVARIVGLRLPLIPGYGEAFVVLAIIIAAKWVLAHLNLLLRALS